MSERLLVLVRHGQSDWNLKNLFTGWKDPDLTEQGIAEAKDAGRKLKAQGLEIRHRLHLGLDARAAHARSDAGRDRPDRAADQKEPRAERARLWRSLRPQQGRRPQEMGRGPGADLAPLLRRAAARRRKPEGYAGAHAALFRPGDPALRAARRARAGRSPRQLAARADHGAGEAVAGRHPEARARHRRADHLPAQRGLRRWRRSSIWRRERDAVAKTIRCRPGERQDDAAGVPTDHGVSRRLLHRPTVRLPSRASPACG